MNPKHILYISVMGISLLLQLVQLSSIRTIYPSCISSTLNWPGQNVYTTGSNFWQIQPSTSRANRLGQRSIRPISHSILVFYDAMPKFRTCYVLLSSIIDHRGESSGCSQYVTKFLVALAESRERLILSLRRVLVCLCADVFVCLCACGHFSFNFWQ